MTDAVNHTSRLLIIVLSALSLSGCQTVRGVLKPYVCDCAPGSTNGTGATAQTCPTDSDPARQGDDSPLTAMAASQQAATTAVERASAEARLESESGEPSLRTLERKAAKEPPRDPLELIDPAVDDAGVDLSVVARADEIQETYGVGLDDDVVAFTGNFTTKPGKELLVVRPGKELAFYSTDSRIAKLEMGGKPASSVFADLGLSEERTRPQPVRLIEDGTLQVMLHWREESEEGASAYKVGVFKVIGPYVGRVFERTLAVRESEDAEVSRLGTYEFLRGDSSRFIRWIPADDTGELLTDQAVTLEWNRWEGVFRVPKPAPTAPKDDELRSERQAGSTDRSNGGSLASR